MGKDSALKLYNALKSQGKYTKSFAEFQGILGDKQRSRKLYTALSNDGLYTKTFSDFSNQFGSGSETPHTTRTQTTTPKKTDFVADTINMLRTPSSQYTRPQPSKAAGTFEMPSKYDIYHNMPDAIKRHQTPTPLKPEAVMPSVPSNAAESVWAAADKAAGAEVRKKVDEGWSWDKILRMLSSGASVTGGLGDDNAQAIETTSVAHLKTHDLQKLSDQAWAALGSKQQQSIINDSYIYLKEQYPDADDKALVDAARKMARAKSDEQMYNLAVEKNMPKSVGEFFLRKAAAASSFGSLSKGYASMMAGTRGDMEAEDTALQKYGAKHKVADIAGSVAGFAVDPLTYASGAVGGAATKVALWAGGKVLSEAAARKMSQTLGGKLLLGAVSGAANFGTFEAGGEAFNQYKWGGTLDVDPETGRYVVGDFSLGKVASQMRHGLTMGGLTGAFGTWLGNVSTKAAQATTSTLGKLGVRAGELGVGLVGEGTIFATPEFISTYGDYNDVIKSVSDKNSPNYIADEKERSKYIAELKAQRGERMMDIWQDNLAMIAGFKAQHAIKSAGRTISELAASRRGKVGFVERMGRMLDGHPSLALSKEEQTELDKHGYGDLTQMVKEYKAYAKNDGDLPYNKITQLLNDKNVSEAARAKMYYYVTGHSLPMSAVIASNVIDNGDKTYTVQSLGDNGVITSRTYGSRKRADYEKARIDRQAELNGVAMAEQMFDNIDKAERLKAVCTRLAQDKGVSPETLLWLTRKDPKQMTAAEKRWIKEIEDAANEDAPQGENATVRHIKGVILDEYGVDVDKALRKAADSRTEAEETAISAYNNELARAVAERKNAIRQDETTDAYRRGYEADTQGMRDAYVAQMYEPSEDNAETLRGVESQITESAKYQAALERDELKQMTHKDGSTHLATLKDKDKDGNGKQVYIVDGDIVMKEDGSGIDADASSKSVIIYDPATGEKKMVSPTAVDGIESLGEVKTAEQREAEINARMQDTIQRDKDWLEGNVANPVGMQIQLGDGRIATIEAMHEDGKSAIATLPDGTQFLVPNDVLQRIVNNGQYADYKARRDAEAGKREAEQSTESAPETATEGGQPLPEEERREYAQGDVFDVVVDGNKMHAEIVSPKDADGRFVVNVDDGESMRTLYVTPEELAAMEYREDPSTKAEETGLATEGSSEKALERGEQPTEEHTPTALERIPRDEKGNAQFHDVDTETAWDGLVEMSGNEETAHKVAEASLANAEKRLKAAKALKEKGETLEELLRSIKENEAAVAEAQRVVDAWKAIVGEKTRREEAAKAEAERKAAEERERAEKEEKTRIEAEKAEEEARVEAEKAEEEARVEAERKAEEERKTKEEERKERDENGQPFVVSSDGTTTFGEITEDTGLTAAPIKLSEGVADEKGNGYGLRHIEARHGDQIRKAGFSSVEEFIEQVAKNYDVIKEGSDRNGNKTYRLLLTDKHNNTLMIELSKDGSYWNVNTAGVFKKSYGKDKKEVYNRHTTVKQSAETAETSQADEHSGTQSTSRMNVPTTSTDKGSEKAEKKQEKQSVFDKAKEIADKEEKKRKAEADKPKQKPLTEAERKDAEEVAGALGYRVEWVDTMAENGTIDADKKVIRIAKDAENPLVQVLGHEVAHGVRRMDGGKFKALQKAAKEVAGEKEWNERIEKKRKLNAYAEGKLAEEVTCDIVGEALNDKDALKRLAESLRGERGILARLRDAVAKMVEYFKNRGDKEGVRRMKAADRLLAEFESALKEGEGVNRSAREAENENVERSVRKSRSEKTELTAEERELRDNLVERMRKGGLDVVTDSEEMQRVIDTENERTRMMGDKQKRALETATIAAEATNNATVISSADGAKIQNNLGTLATNYEKIANKTRGFITDLSHALGLKQHESSQYGTFETPDGKRITIRVSNHNARVSNFDKNNESEGISIVISSHKNKGLHNDGNAHIIEYFYPKRALENAEGKPLAEMIRSVSDALAGEEFKDTTGLAEREEVNGSSVREHRVYHGSGADFDAFDHSHMGEGEGAQAYGWGTYVTEVEGIGRTYAVQNTTKHNDALRALQHDVDAISDQLNRHRDDLKYDEEQLKRANEWRAEAELDYELFKDEAEKLKEKYGEASPEYRNHLFNDIYTDEMKRAQSSVKSTEESIQYRKEKIAELEKALKDKQAEVDELPKKFPRHLYTVEIPDDNGSNYLDWDGHPAESLLKDVGSFLESNGFERVQDSPVRYEKGESTVVLNPNATGADLYAELQEALGGDKKASQALAELGYTGIKYPADNMRGGRKDGAKNYVIFNENDAKITAHTRFLRTAGGEVYGLVKDGRIYLDPKVATSETAVHEYTHLWGDMLRRKESEQWSRTVKELKNSVLWEEVKELYPELKTDDEIADEVLSTFSGRRGAERLREEARRVADGEGGVFTKAKAIETLERVKEAIARFWEGVARMFGINRYRSAEELADMAMKDLLDSKNPMKDESGMRKRGEVGETLATSGTYFSGGGLLEAGLKGVIDPKVAVEFSEKIAGVYADNHGNHIVVADVRDVDPKKLVGAVDGGEVQYFHASPVCKNFSKAKREGGEVELDKETALSTAEFIAKTRPKVVTIENVKGYRNSEALKIITDELTRQGYDWDADVYNTADYGGYTKRERLIVRAKRDGKLPPKPEKLPEELRKKGWYSAVEDLIPHLEEKKTGVPQGTDERLKNSGIDYRTIDKPLYVFGRGYANKTVGHAFADELLPTLTTGGGDIIIMPDGRVLKASPRVLARVTGLPDTYKMPETDQLSHTIVGNGIPTQLTEGVIAPLLDNAIPSAERATKRESVFDVADRVSQNLEERTRNMFVGEKGATEADKAEEVSTRLDNLSVARRMEEAGKDAKTIKMATGWERGSDGKWRYETGDAKIKDTIELDGKTFKRYDEDMLWTSGKFGDVVDAPELFKAYPELRDVRIETDAVLNDMPSNGEYNPRTNTITIHSDDLKYQNSILNHEIQHAIQHIEGFETGGSAENVRERIQQIIDNSSDEVGYARERLREWADLNAMAAMLDVAYRKFVGSGNEWERAKAVEIYWDAINTIEDNDKAELVINYPHDKTPREVAESGYLVDDVIRELNRLADETRKEIPDGNIGTMREVDRLVDALKDKTDFELYKSIAGEVEARNTEKRIGMTEEERRASLASETEDVAREDQILLRQGDIMRSEAAATPLKGEEALTALDSIFGENEGSAIPPKISSFAKFKNLFKKPVRTFLGELVQVKDEVWNKILRNNRQDITGTVLPTIENADFAIRDTDGSTLYVKRFKGDGQERMYNVVVVNKHGEVEDYISSVHIKRDNNLRNKIKKGAELFLPNVRTTDGTMSRNNSTPDAKVANYSETAKPRFSRKPGESIFDYASRVSDSVDRSVRERVSARDEYEKKVKSKGFQTKEALQNSMLGLQEFMYAIDHASGNKRYIEDIPDFENPILGENRLSSVNKEEMHQVAKTQFKPLMSAVAKLSGNGKESGELYDYMFAKHGLERDAVMRQREAQKEFDKYQKANPKGTKTIGDFVASLEGKDYAGLTALTAEDGRVKSIQSQIDAIDEQMKATDDQLLLRNLGGQKKRLKVDLLNAARDAADDIRKAFESDPNHNLSDINELWSRVNEVNGNTLRKLYESGMLTKEAYNDISSMYTNYIPMRGFDQTTSADAYAYLTHGDSAFNAPIKTAKGRSSKADNPIAYMQAMAESAIMQGNRNVLVKQKMLNFVRNHPSDLASVSDVWLQYDSVADEWKPVFPDNIGANDSASVVAKKMEAFEDKMKQMAEKHPDLVQRSNEAPDIPYKVVEKGQLNEHQVLVKQNGKSYIITVNGSPRAAQAANGLTNPDTDLTGAVGKVFEGAEALNRQLSSLYTTLNPDFIGSNYVRDALYSNTMVYVKEGAKYGGSFNLNFAKYNPAEMANLYASYNKGSLDTSNETHRLFLEFMQNGGETGFVNLKQIEKRKSEIAKAIKRDGRISAAQIWGGLSDAVDFANRAVENSARFAAYVTSRKSGRSVGRSVYDAKEISVNFNRKGSGSKFMGAEGQTKAGNAAAFVSGAGRGLYIFWNAGLQGLTNFSRQIGRHPGRALTLASLLFGFGALMSYLGNRDDDDENNYFNLPKYIRRSNVCYKIGDLFVTIPLPVEYRSFYGLGELASSTLAGKEDGTTKDIAKEAVSQVSQLFPIDFAEGGGGLHALIPSAVKPIVEAETNTAWTGLPIYKDNEFNKNMPEYTKVYKTANGHLVEIARALNDATGGNKYKKGFIDINPAKMEYVLKGMLGGAFSFPDKLVKTTETIMGDREFDWRNTPFANRFVKNADERMEYKALNEQYFKLKDEMDVVKQQLKGFEKEADAGNEKYEKALLQLEDSKDYERLELFKDYEKELKGLNDELKELRISPDYDKAEEKELQKEIAELQRQLLDEMREIKK
nr:MAG TPA: cytosine DNA methyltransferase [Caudoviricetes sp.]